MKNTLRGSDMNHKVQISLIDDNGVVTSASTKEFEDKQDAENAFEDSSADLKCMDGGVWIPHGQD